MGRPPKWGHENAENQGTAEGTPAVGVASVLCRILFVPISGHHPEPDGKLWLDDGEDVVDDIEI